jgi:response regulator NasT
MERRLKELSLENEKLEKKLQDERYISRAKALLIERKQMTETDAHKYLEHTAMNQGLTRREVAIRVIRENGRIIVNT